MLLSHIDTIWKDRNGCEVTELLPYIRTTEPALVFFFFFNTFLAYGLWLFGFRKLSKQFVLADAVFQVFIALSISCCKRNNFAVRG